MSSQASWSKERGSPSDRSAWTSSRPTSAGRTTWRSPTPTAGSSRSPWRATRERIAGRSGKPEFCDFTVYDRADQAPIGWSSLFHIDHRNGTAQFGIDLGERRGQGLGTEATRLTLDWGFSVLGLHNIMLAVAAWNERAIRVYTKVGFREVGRRRGAGLTMGRRHDGVFMDLLATEFLQANESVLAGRAPHGLRPASR